MFDRRETTFVIVICGQILLRQLLQSTVTHATTLMHMCSNAKKHRRWIRDLDSLVKATKPPGLIDPSLFDLVSYLLVWTAILWFADLVSGQPLFFFLVGISVGPTALAPSTVGSSLVGFF